MYNEVVAYEWNSKKNQSNIRKYRVNLADAVSVFDDEHATTIIDDSSQEEQRFVTLELDANARVLVVVYTYREETIRIISARLAEPQERKQYKENL